MKMGYKMVVWILFPGFALGDDASQNCWKSEPYEIASLEEQTVKINSKSTNRSPNKLLTSIQRQQ